MTDTTPTAELRAAAQQARAERADRAAIYAEVLPDWEAVYEPGNVSDYLIGYANDQAAATGMAEAWMRSQAEVTGRLEWVSEERLATGRYDRWFELIERHDDGIDTGPGIIVRRRLADETATDEPDAEVIHAFPPTGSGLTPCCGRTPFELPRTDRISSEAPTTCTGPAAGPPRTPADHLRAASLAAFSEGGPAGSALGWWLRDTATIHVPDSSGRTCERDGDDFPCLDVRAALKYAELINHLRSDPRNSA
jgi:hypothetical protein